MTMLYRLVAGAILVSATLAGAAPAADIELGPRPAFLIDKMAEGALKDELLACDGKPVSTTLFSIGHRGAPLQFPEHTRESYMAAAKMGAGIIECDVTFTKDKELVCRHAQNDLHTTTNILATDLAQKCTKGFTPAAGGQGFCRVSRLRHHPCRSSSTLDGQDGRSQQPGRDRRGLHGRYRGVADRPLCGGRRHGVDPPQNQSR